MLIRNSASTICSQRAPNARTSSRPARRPPPRRGRTIAPGASRYSATAGSSAPGLPACWPSSPPARSPGRAGSGRPAATISTLPPPAASVLIPQLTKPAANSARSVDVGSAFTVAHAYAIGECVARKQNCQIADLQSLMHRRARLGAPFEPHRAPARSTVDHNEYRPAVTIAEQRTGGDDERIIQCATTMRASTR